MHDKPVNLNLFTIAFPVTAIVSILHRISGLFLIVAIPFFLMRLQSELYYPVLVGVSRLGKIILWLGASALIYHLLAGIRHLVMDCGVAESKRAARVSAYLVLALSVVLSLLFGKTLC